MLLRNLPAVQVINPDSRTSVQCPKSVRNLRRELGQVLEGIHFSAEETGARCGLPYNCAPMENCLSKLKVLAEFSSNRLVYKCDYRFRPSPLNRRSVCLENTLLLCLECAVMCRSGTLLAVCTLQSLVAQTVHAANRTTPKQSNFLSRASACDLAQETNPAEEVSAAARPPSGSVTVTPTVRTRRLFV